MSPYAYADYKRYLSDFIAKSEGRGMKSALAAAAGCQRSFFSQMLSGPANLTQEHAIGIAKYLRLEAPEADYFFCLVGAARAGSRDLQAYYQSKMRTLRWTGTQAKEAGEKTMAGEGVIAEYYSSWKYGAIHMAATLPHGRTAPAIARRLSLTATEVELVLRRLKAWQLVSENARAEWSALNSSIHLPQDHFMTWANHRQWRAKNLEVQERQPGRGTMYTALYSMSRSDFERLKENVAGFLAESRSLVRASKNEDELVSFTLDCVPLS